MSIPAVEGTLIVTEPIDLRANADPLDANLDGVTDLADVALLITGGQAANALLLLENLCGY